MAGSAGASMALNGPVVLLRSTTPEALANLDLTGKIVLLQVEDTSDARAVFTALRPLQGLGAAAILTVQRQWVSGGIQGRGGASRGAGNRAAQGTRGRPASLSFGGDDLTAVLGLAGVDPAGTEALTDLGLTADLKLVIADGDAPAWNVVGRLPGSDPARKDECVVIGSHLDHLGRRGSTIYPGADDDGSGTTGVLAVAQMFARNKVRPARSIVFVCFCGEENGLVGSRYFVQNCPIPLASIVSELQMDMIGRDEEANSESRTEAERSEQAEQNLNTVHLIGTQKLAPALHELCMAKNGTAGFELEWDQEGMFGRSDHANFARMGVPIAFFFTGLHADYHQPSDTPDKIHYEKLLRIATWVYDIGFELATQAARPEIDPQLWAAYRSRGSEQPAAPMAGGNGGGR
jgi:hypothetical protein